LQKIAETTGKEKIAAHFHEWLAGAGLLFLKKNKSRIKTIFTTHATSLGRTLAYNNIEFYNFIKDIDPQKEAARLNVTAKHLLEKSTAVNCDIFTTVSEITALEAEYFLQRKPELILPNGLNEEQFPSFEELMIEHKIHRNRLRNFLLFYFFPYYSFDLEQTLFFFTASRYEVRAKGIDIFIKSLGELNKKMRQEKTKKTMEETLALAKELNCDSIQFYPLIVYPGTESYQWAKENNYLKTSDYDNWLDDCGMYTSLLDQPQLKSQEVLEFCNRATREYYLRPAYILMKSRQIIFSPREIIRTAKAAKTFFKNL